MDKTKRKNIENMIYEIFDIMDKTGKNTAYYKNKYSKMSDAQFEKHFKEFLEDESANFYLELTPYESEPTSKDKDKAAKLVDVELFEYVALPFVNEDTEDPVLTPVKVPVIPVHVKREQQLLVKKNSMSIHTSMRNPKTGQVMSKDKNGIDSDVENMALLALGAEATMKEFLTMRSDDLTMKTEMNNKIKTDGYVAQKDLTSLRTNKVALNTLDVHFLSAGIKTNLISNSLVLPNKMTNLNKSNASTASKYTTD